MNYQQPKYYDNNPQPTYDSPFDDATPLQPFETFELTPGCMYICFMMPFPFFCIGCCLSQTAKFRFDNNSRVMSIKSYCGFCCCCSNSKEIPYDDITNLDIRLIPGCRINHQAAYKVFLLYKEGEIELTGGVVYSEAMGVDQQVKAIMARFRIAAAKKGRAPMMPGNMGLVYGPGPVY